MVLDPYFCPGLCRLFMVVMQAALHGSCSNACRSDARLRSHANARPAMNVVQRPLFSLSRDPPKDGLSRLSIPRFLSISIARRNNSFSGICSNVTIASSVSLTLLMFSGEIGSGMPAIARWQACSSPQPERQSRHKRSDQSPMLSSNKFDSGSVPNPPFSGGLHGG